MTSARLISIDALEEWTGRVLVAAGLRELDARHVAQNLLFAERRGVVTHGLIRLPVYVERIRGGGINAAPKMSSIADIGALVVLDADHAPGASSGVAATEIAIERAHAHGIGCVIARNANHFGASGFYTDRIADADMLGIAICNTEAVMCAPFGGRPVLGTNPIAVAVPLPPDRRPQLDMATTTASQGKLLVAKQEGQPIPLGWAVDAKGTPTQSAAAGLEGALLPSGGPKGFGLAFAIDAILAISGAKVSPEATALQGDPTQHQNLGHAFIAIRVDAAGPLGEYRERIDRLVNAVHASGIEGQTLQPLFPGEPELARARSIDGNLTVGPDVLHELASIANHTGVALPAPTEAVKA
jgi:LDH2 family malate/lactate/ureidoglycolate dehydrogenase